MANTKTVTGGRTVARGEDWAERDNALIEGARFALKHLKRCDDCDSRTADDGARAIELLEHGLKGRGAQAWHDWRDNKPGAERPRCSAVEHIEDAQAPAVTVEDCAQFVKDAAAYIRWLEWPGGSFKPSVVLGTLIHDIMGLDNGEECFSPRVSGYAAKEAVR